MHDRNTRAFVSSLVLLVAATASIATTSQPGDGARVRYVPGEVLVKFRTGTDPGDVGQARAALAATSLDVFRSRAERWRLGPGIDVEQAMARLRANPLVDYVEPNYLVESAAVPNDPRIGDLWGLINTGQSGGTPDADIDADLAWNLATGSSAVVVGIIDTGVDNNHVDLAANVWTNPGEIPGNGIDDDGNGYVDDVHGYDFVNGDGDPFDDNGHGTHAAGTIGAVGNNGFGIVGVNWTVRIMALKFLDAGGSGTTANAVRALDYAVAMGADVTSNAYGGGSFSQTFYEAIARAGDAETVFVAAAGGSQHDNDLYPTYPASYDLPCIIAVAGTDRNDLKLTSSNWGRVSVDLGAPGGDILSTRPGNAFQVMSGSSMATAHVAGACALIRAVSPGIPVAALKGRLLDSVDLIPSMNGIVASNGRLNAFRAIAEFDGVPPGRIEDLRAGDPGATTMALDWTATGNDGDVGTASYYEVRHSTLPIDEASWSAAARAGNEPLPLPSGSRQSMVVRGLAADTLHYFAIKAFDGWGNAGPISNLASASTLPPPVAEVDPTEIVTALPPGGARTKTLTLRNSGGSNLEWTAKADIVSASPNVAQHESYELGKEDADARESVLGSGGPDRFGYRYKDSDSPGGPVFDWFDISSVGTEITFGSFDDANAGPIPIGFEFPFYGNVFTSVRASTNGWLSFTSSATDFSNDTLPSTSSPGYLLAVFHDDLHFRGVQRARYFADATRFVVQYTDVDKYSPSGAHLTFQVVLHPNGRIVFQYLTMVGTLTSATVGIQNGTGDDGLTVVYNSSYVHDHLAIEFEKIPDWMRVEPAGGTVPPGGSVDLSVLLDAAGLEDGVHEGTIAVDSDDPAHPRIVVPVRLNVGIVPTAWTEFDPDVLNLSSNGRFVTMRVELPSNLDPFAIRPSSVLLLDAIPALEDPPPDYRDANHNGVVDVGFKFERSAVEQLLPEGQEVAVPIQGEVEDVQWWRGTDTVRTMRPRVTSPGAGALYSLGTTVPIRWDPPMGGEPRFYDVQLSRDGEATWEVLASGVAGLEYEWTATGGTTTSAVVRVLAFDDRGLMGFDTGDGAFTISEVALAPPNPVADTLVVSLRGTDLQLDWEAPTADADHGAADRYPVLRAENPAGPFTRVAVVTGGTRYVEPLAATQGAGAFYRIVAANAAGEAE